MISQEKIYKKKVIFPLLRNSLYGALATFDNFKINSRFMLFTCTPELDRFFFITKKDSKKIAEISSNSMGTLSVISEIGGTSDTSETIVRGDIKVFTDFSSPEASEAFRGLSEKSGSTELSTGADPSDYSILILYSKEIIFRIYSDVLKEVPRTVIRFK